MSKHYPGTRRRTIRICLTSSFEVGAQNAVLEPRARCILPILSPATIITSLREYKNENHTSSYDSNLPQTRSACSEEKSRLDVYEREKSRRTGNTIARRHAAGCETDLSCCSLADSSSQWERRAYTAKSILGCIQPECTGLCGLCLVYACVRLV